MNPFDAFRKPFCDAGAFGWLVWQADADGKVKASFRQMQAEFGWSLGKVQRFVKRIEKEGLATQKAIQGETVISLTMLADSRAIPAKTDTQTDTPQMDLFAEPDSLNEKAYRYPKPTPLPPSFQLPRSWGEWAMEQGLERAEVIREATSFRAYWIEKGATVKGKKKAWALAWRKWINSPHRRRYEPTSPELDAYAAKLGALQ